MTRNIMQFKAHIKKFAHDEGIPAQVALQNFMFERFFARLCRSDVRENMVLKGGTLISQYLGLSRRTTMDIDITMRNATLNEKTVSSIIKKVFSVDLNDGIEWKLATLVPIRDDDLYGGFRAKAIALFESMSVPFSIDISTGDAITPGPEDYLFKSVFNTNTFYKLKAYPIETIVAEKIETILSRGTLSTRPRDYYDVYMLTNVVTYSTQRLKTAIRATARHRKSSIRLSESGQIIAQISQSKIMEDRWQKYQQQYSFAKDITFDRLCAHLDALLSEL